MSRLSLIVVALPLLARAQEAPRAAPDEGRSASREEPSRRREISTVQKRLFEKQRRVELDVVSGVVPNDAFRLYVPVGLRAAYHLSERLAVEAQALAELSMDTGLRKFLTDHDSDLDSRSRDRQRGRFDVAALWTPLYGKASTGARLVHFDAFVGGGAGAVATTVDPDVTARAALKIAPEAELAGGVRAFLTQRWLVTLGVRQYVYLRPAPAGGSATIGTPTEIGVGIGTWFGGGK